MNKENCGIPLESRPYLKIHEAAKKLCLTYSVVYQAAKNGKFDAVKVGNRWLLPKASVQDFLTNKFKVASS